MNNPKLMQYEQDILKSHLQNLQKPKQEMFIEKYKLLPDEDKEIILQQIASQTPEFLELAKGEQPQLEFKMGGEIPKYQQGGTRFDGDSYVDKYGNTITQRGNLNKGVGLSMAPEVPVKTEVPVSTKIDEVTGFYPAITIGNTVDKPATVKRPVDTTERDDIRKLQSSLKQAGFDPGPIDGIKGKRTEAALKRAEADGFGIYKNDKGYEIVGRTKSETNNVFNSYMSKITGSPVLPKLDIPQSTNSPSMLKFTATDESTKGWDSLGPTDVSFDAAIQAGLIGVPLKIPGLGRVISAGSGKFLTSTGNLVTKTGVLLGKAPTSLINKSKDLFKVGESTSQQTYKAMLEGTKFRNSAGKFESFATGTGKFVDTRGTVQKLIQDTSITRPLKTALQKSLETGKRVTKELYDKLSKTEKNQYDSFFN
jgi:Putative peptidoglycan binding domain